MGYAHQRTLARFAARAPALHTTYRRLLHRAKAVLLFQAIRNDRGPDMMHAPAVLNQALGAEPGRAYQGAASRGCLVRLFVVRQPPG